MDGWMNRQKKGKKEQSGGKGMQRERGEKGSRGRRIDGWKEGKRDG